MFLNIILNLLFLSFHEQFVCHARKAFHPSSISPVKRSAIVDSLSGLSYVCMYGDCNNKYEKVGFREKGSDRLNNKIIDIVESRRSEGRERGNLL